MCSRADNIKGIAEARFVFKEATRLLNTTRHQLDKLP